MLPKLKLTAGQFLSDPNKVRAILVLSTLLIAAVAGGAPNDPGH
jgi:hypothetical protein